MVDEGRGHGHGRTGRDAPRGVLDRGVVVDAGEAGAGAAEEAEGLFEDGV